MKKVLAAALILITAGTACKTSKQPEGTFELNDNTSVAEWKGATPDHFHVGSFSVKGSMAVNAEGLVESGSFVIPISSIRDFDLPEEVKPQLLNHLKSADFFNVALHPNAEFKVTRIEPITAVVTAAKAGTVEGANQLVTGDFSMVGQTHPITFPAKVAMVGDSLKVESTLKIDRSKWGMSKYTTPGTAEYIIPEADIHLKLTAAKKTAK